MITACTQHLLFPTVSKKPLKIGHMTTCWESPENEKTEECIVVVRRGEEGEGWRGEREGREGKKERAILRDFLMTAAKAALQEKGRNQAMSKTERQMITPRVKPELLTVALSAYL